MAVGIGYTGSIAYHTTGRGEFAERIDCRHQDASILRSGLSSDVQAAIGQRLLAQHAQTEGPIFLKLRLLGTFCLLLSLLILIAAPAAHAVCRSPKNICMARDFYPVRPHTCAIVGIVRQCQAWRGGSGSFSARQIRG
jgi:hypothetical protein